MKPFTKQEFLSLLQEYATFREIELLEQGTNSQRPYPSLPLEPVRLKYPASKGISVVLPNATKEVIDTAGDVFDVKLVRSDGEGTGDRFHSLFKLGKIKRRDELHDEDYS